MGKASRCHPLRIAPATRCACWPSAVMPEDACRGLAARIGLNLFIQGDPRGCALYVAVGAIGRDSYSTDGVAIFPQER